MKTLVQNYRNGELQLIETAKPACGENDIIIKTQSSIVSVGTEKSISTLARKNLLQKAKSRPDLVKRVVEKVKTEGLAKTYGDVLGRLEKLTPLGYSACGTVIEVGSNIQDFQTGDFVAVIGAEIATHSSLIIAPEMMCLKLSKDIGNAAAFGMLGIIAMHGVRCSGQQPGSVIGVIGLGILGILTAQILIAYGFQVVGFDPDVKKMDLCKALGLTNVFSDRHRYIKHLNHVSNGAGGDATIIAAATQSSTPVEDAVNSTRNGGKIVVTGVVDIHPDRNELWHKEIELVVSRAGGPGGLDSLYEVEGVDLPIQYARWSQKRNLQEFFRLVETKAIDPEALISSYTHIDNAGSLFEKIIDGRYSGLAPLIYYEENTENSFAKIYKRKIAIDNCVNDESNKDVSYDSEVFIDVIGAGQFARSALLPNLYKMNKVSLNRIATKTPASSFLTKKKFSFSSTANDPEELFLNTKNSNGLIIATRHSLHFNYIQKAINSGYNHIFVEKPMVTSRKELQDLKMLQNCDRKNIMVGYNRRYSPHTRQAKAFFEDDRITNVSYIVNAGFVPRDHWVFATKEGRSRIVGEMCHFFDFFQYITGSKIVEVIVNSIAPVNDKELAKDNIAVICKMYNGSICNLTYCSTGHRGLSRENVYMHGSGRSVHIDNFTKSRFYSSDKSFTKRTFGQSIGYHEEMAEFVKMIQGQAEPQSFSDLCNVMDVCFTVEELLGGV